MIKNFSFHMPVNILFDKGITRNLEQYIKGDNVMLVCDPFLYQCGQAEKLCKYLPGKNVAVFSDIEPNPSCECVDEAARKARAVNANCVIGLGGGSSMDVSKIVSCLVTNEGSIYDYYAGGSRTLSPRRAQLICIPTTAGTGSEVTNVGVFTNRKTGVKMPMVNNQFWADIAMLDPELTYTLPGPVTASTGMDAFCHAIEAFWNKESIPVCDMLAMGAMKLILDNILAAYANSSDEDARGAMLLASLTAGIAFSQTRTTGIHALSFPLTVDFGANHGTACSITLPAFIRLCYGQSKEKMDGLLEYLNYKTIGDFAKAVEDLMKSMKMPIRLHELGVKESDIPQIAKTGLNAAIIQLTPAEMNEETVCGLLSSIL